MLSCQMSQVNLYSAFSWQTFNALNTLSGTVHRTLRIPHDFGQRQRVPDGRTSNRKIPTAVRAEPVAWNGDLMTAGPIESGFRTQGHHGPLTYARIAVLEFLIRLRILLLNVTGLRPEKVTGPRMVALCLCQTLFCSNIKETAGFLLAAYSYRWNCSSMFFFINKQRWKTKNVF